LYNYADDNTLSFSSPDYDILISTLEAESQVLIDWFKDNKMQANPDKFQVLAVGEKKPLQKIHLFKFKIIYCHAKKLKLWGIDIDYQLKFDQHISNLCRKASQQLNFLKRLGSYLTKLNKLTIFHTFILNNFNFCPLAWHFCTEKKFKSELCDLYMMIINPPLKLCLKMQRFPPYKRDVSGQWHLRITKFYTIWLLYVYKIYSILKIQNITLDTEISWMYHK
jgi:hypothetical protein